MGSSICRGSYMTLGTSTVGALFLLFFLAGLVNPLLKLVHPRAGLNRGELLLIYIMMVMASPLPVFLPAGSSARSSPPFTLPRRKTTGTPSSSPTWRTGWSRAT